MSEVASSVAKRQTCCVCNSTDADMHTTPHSDDIATLNVITQEDAFDTCWLLRLRAIANSSADIAEGSLFTEAQVHTLRTARADYNRLASDLSEKTTYQSKDAQLEDAKLVLECFKHVWVVLSDLPEKHPLYLPPIYIDHTTLNNLLMQVIMAIRSRERDPDAKRDTGHFIVGGVEGTGKTTLMKCICIAVAVCSSSYFLAYIDYKQLINDYKQLKYAYTPRDIAVEILVRLATENFEATFGDSHYITASADATELMKELNTYDIWYLLAMINESFGFRVGIVADEIQERITPAQLEADIFLLKDVENYARHCAAALLVITGSSTDLRSRFFARDRDPSYARFPDFNRSLCGYVHLNAFRTVDALKSYIKQRYPLEKMFHDDESVRHVLHHTGGIGKFVHKYVTQASEPFVRELDPTEVYAETLNGLGVLMNLIRRHSGLSDDSRKRKTELLTPAEVSILKAEALRELNDRGIHAAESTMKQLVDVGLLYVFVDERGFAWVQPARPSDAFLYFGE